MFFHIFFQVSLHLSFLPFFFLLSLQTTHCFSPSLNIKMQFKLLSTLALAGSAVAAYSNVTDVVVTEVVTAFTTYCPEATTFTTNNKTWTVTEATTLTITDCPCTLTHTTTKAPQSEETASSTESTASTFTGAAAKAGVAGLAAAAGAAVYLL